MFKPVLQYYYFKYNNYVGMLHDCTSNAQLNQEKCLW